MSYEKIDVMLPKMMPLGAPSGPFIMTPLRKRILAIHRQDPGTSSIDICRKVHAPLVAVVTALQRLHEHGICDCPYGQRR